MQSPVIDVRGLTRKFGSTEALRGLDVQVPQGSVCGFLGRNGAGKTTTLKILLGLLAPDAGSARVFGLNCTHEPSSVAIRQRTGTVTETKALYPYLTVENAIRFTRGFYPKWRADLEQQYMRMFELPPRAKVCSLSKGTLTKLNVLLALCRGADLLILDEATDGLDAAVIEEVLQSLMAQVADDGTTVFFSSHQLSVVEQIADRVCLIHKGQTVLQESLDDLRANARRVQLIFDTEPGHEAAARLASFGIVRQEGRAVSVLTRTAAEDVVELGRTLRAISADVQPVTLKELFLESVRS